jgi:hypothetical protein
MSHRARKIVYERRILEEPTFFDLPTMSRPDQPDASRSAADENRPSLQETLEQRDKTCVGLDRIKAQSDAVASLARILDSLIEEDDDGGRKPL